MKLTFKSELLYFNRPFKISHGIRSFTPIVLTQIEHEGLIGFGEASLPPYLNETQESVFLFLNKAAKLLASYSSSLNLENIIKHFFVNFI